MAAIDSGRRSRRGSIAGMARSCIPSIRCFRVFGVFGVPVFPIAQRCTHRQAATRIIARPMTYKHCSRANAARCGGAAAVLSILCLLVPAASLALGPNSDARESTYLEYSRNLVAAYPRALERRIREMERRASTDLSALEMCRRAVERVPGDLEGKPHRRIELVAAGPIGRAPDDWEARALSQLATDGGRALHAFVRMAPGNDGPIRQVFRYMERLDGLPAPCGGLLEAGGAGPAISIRRQAGIAEGGARSKVPESSAPRLPLPFPNRQGPKR